MCNGSNQFVEVVEVWEDGLGILLYRIECIIFEKISRGGKRSRGHATFQVSDCFENSGASQCRFWDVGCCFVARVMCMCGWSIIYGGRVQGFQDVEIVWGECHVWCGRCEPCIGHM